MTYFIGDLHLFCKSQTNEGSVNWDGRPFDTVEEMNAEILRRWNAKVNNSDTVVILGDVSMRGKNDALIGLVAQLRGKKILVVGNHDETKDYRYRQLYHEVVDYKEMEVAFGGKNYKLVCCHYPLMYWRDQHRGTIHLYAHTHNTIEDDFYQGAIAKMNASEEMSLRRHGGQKIIAINTGCMKDYMDYEPRSLEEMMGALGYLD